MRRNLPWIIAILITGCAPDPRKSIQIAHVSHGEAIQPDAVTLTLLPEGVWLRNGTPTRIEDIPELQRRGPEGGFGHGWYPILLEVDRSRRFKDVTSLVDQLIQKGKRPNQGFLVDTNSGKRVIPMCIPIAMSPPGLYFIDGPRTFSECGDREKSHVWIDLRVAPLELTDVRIGKWIASKFYGAQEGEKIRPWTGDRPPDGAWTIEGLKSFLSRTDVASERPIITVTISTEDEIGPCLAAVAELRQLGAQIMFWYPEAPNTK